MAIMKSKSTVESSSAGLQKELSNRFNLTHTSTQKIRRKQPTTNTARTRNSTFLERERGPLRRNNSTVCSNTPLPLNSIDWKQKEAIALTRAGLTQSCAICHETYQYSYSSTKYINTKSSKSNSNSNSNSIMHVKTNNRRGSQSQSQTILCCSHVFHTNCLASFERFVGFENRFCPLCRGGVGCYSKMLTDVGSLARERNAVVIVQKVVRGYIVRKEFRCRLRSYYAHHAFVCEDEDEDEDEDKNNEDKKEDGMIVLKNIRQKFYVKELEHLGGKMQKQIECNGYDLKQLEEKINKSLGASRELDEMLTDSGGVGVTFASSVASNVKWDIVMKAAFERGDEAGTGTDTGTAKGRCNDNNASDYEKQNKNTCPICMSIMDHRHRRNVTLLSCSHLFCTSCIESFETFNAHRVDMNAHSCVCPVCRSSYEKLQVIL